MIDINKRNKVFHLKTDDTSYVFRVNDDGIMFSLHFGGRINNALGCDSLTEKQPCFSLTPYDNRNYSIDNVCLEVSGTGKGDFRQPMSVIYNKDGTYVNNFRFVDYKVLQSYDGKYNAATYGADDVLEIELFDKEAGLSLFLYYCVFEKSNVITRSAKLVNKSGSDVVIDRLLSMQLDLPYDDFTMLTFDGAWARERIKCEHVLGCGVTVNESLCGASSNKHNPFILLKRYGATEDNGECFGINLIYSGNHYEAIECTPFRKSRTVAGINPTLFNWKLKDGEEFLTPEAVLTYSDKGTGGISRNMHAFINENVVRGVWKGKPRPILINSWEAMYFDINEASMHELAGSAKKLGVELFVMDDGWFGHRDNDRTSLGDWYSHPKKFPDGVASLAKKIHDMGLLFGIWVEPEMINEKSDLFKAHPDWAVIVPGREPTRQRNQLHLDFTNKEVREYIIGCMTKIFSETQCDYVKWDYNRMFSDMFGSTLERQGEFLHRYTLGLYEVVSTLVNKFPKILFESCASGGNRFDLGMLCFMPQTWCSDDTDAFNRTYIQEGTNYCYPVSATGAHVSGLPNDQSLRGISIETRFNVASFGAFGYELDLSEISRFEQGVVKKQIEFYKEHRELFQFGTYYRLFDGFNGNYNGWQVVSKDKKHSIFVFMVKHHIPNYRSDMIRLKGLDENKVYRVSARRTLFPMENYVGLVRKLLKLVSPVRLKKDGFVCTKILKRVNIKAPKENYLAGGDQLMKAGIKLAQGFNSCGISMQTRMSLDYYTAMYLVDEA